MEKGPPPPRSETGDYGANVPYSSTTAQALGFNVLVNLTSSAVPITDGLGCVPNSLYPVA